MVFMTIVFLAGTVLAILVIAPFLTSLPILEISNTQRALLIKPLHTRGHTILDS